jgi:Flp pilus assembly protein TadD
MFIADLMDRVRRRRESGRLLRRGNKLYQRGDLAAAAQSYREAVTCDPHRAVLRFNLGLVLYKLGEKAAARAEWQTALDLTEGKSPYLAEQCRIMLRQFG